MRYIKRRDVIKLDIDQDTCVFDLNDSNDVTKLGIEIGYRLYHVSVIVGFCVNKIECYETSKGFHVYIIVNRELEPIYIVLSQLALLSDYKREILYTRFINDKSLDWNYLDIVKYHEGSLVSVEHITELSKLLLKSIISGFIHKTIQNARLIPFSVSIYNKMQYG